MNLLCIVSFLCLGQVEKPQIEKEFSKVQFALSSMNLTPEPRLQKMATWLARSNAFTKTADTWDCLNFNTRQRADFVGLKTASVLEYPMKAFEFVPEEFEDIRNDCFDYTHAGICIVEGKDGVFYLTITLAKFPREYF
jgi:hypothetical protein